MWGEMSDVHRHFMSTIHAARCVGHGPLGIGAALPRDAYDPIFCSDSDSSMGSPILARIDTILENLAAVERLLNKFDLVTYD